MILTGKVCTGKEVCTLLCHSMYSLGVLHLTGQWDLAELSSRNWKGFAALQSLSTEVQDTGRLCSNSIKGRRFDVTVHIGAHNVAD